MLAYTELTEAAAYFDSCLSYRAQHTWCAVQNSIDFEQRYLQGFSACTVVQQAPKPHKRQGYSEHGTNLHQHIG